MPYIFVFDKNLSILAIVFSHARRNERHAEFHCSTGDDLCGLCVTLPEIKWF